MKLVYSILDAPLPVEAYRTTMQVTDLGNGKSELMWSFSFNPKGASEKDLVNYTKPVHQGISQVDFILWLEIFLKRAYHVIYLARTSRWITPQYFFQSGLF